MARVASAEAKILRALSKAGRLSVEELQSRLGLDHSALMRTVLALKERGLVEVEEETLTRFRLTEEGFAYASGGLPERRLAEAALSLGGQAEVDAIVERSGLPPRLATIALGWVVRKGWGSMERGGGATILKVGRTPGVGEDERLLRLLAQKAGHEATSRELGPAELELARGVLSRRNLLEEKVQSTRFVKLSEAGRRVAESPRLAVEEAAEEVTMLTGDLIASGRWREVKLKEYDVKTQPPPAHPGKKHFYLEFLEEVRRLLLSMGFTEARGPYVETEFWNFDVLFQAQDHPAREIHDSYLVKEPSAGEIPDRSLAERVKRAHEEGWRYSWRLDLARRLVLRTQTTAVSARYLYRHPNPPVKMFCLSRVFRPDVLDSKHSMEFTQCEGIMMDAGLNFRHLLWFLGEFARGLGLGEVRFYPGYFPFTEPSVESFARHPTLGWIEFAGAGMFRPEVLKPLGIVQPVLAWGIGIDRLAMIRLNVDDIRELFTRRLDFLRER